MSNIREDINKHLSDNVAQYDCQGDCPDEVAIYEKEHYGETLRTAKYCDKCFTDQIISLIADKLTVIGNEETPYVCVGDLFPVNSTERTTELFVRWGRNKKEVAKAQLQHTIKEIRSGE